MSVIIIQMKNPSFEDKIKYIFTTSYKNGDIAWMFIGHHLMAFLNESMCEECKKKANNNV